MARYTYPTDELEKLYGEEWFRILADEMGSMFGKAGLENDVQWGLYNPGVFSLDFAEPYTDEPTTLFMAPDWDDDVGITTSIVTEGGHSDHLGHVPLKWSGQSHIDAGLMVGATIATIANYDTPGRGGTSTPGGNETHAFLDALQSAMERAYKPLEKLHRGEFDTDRFGLEATKSLGLGERVYYDYPGFFNFWVDHIMVLATPDWDLPGTTVQLDIYENEPPHIGDIEETIGIGGELFLPWRGDYETDAALWVGAVVGTLELNGVEPYASGRPLLGVR